MDATLYQMIMALAQADIELKQLRAENAALKQQLTKAAGAHGDSTQ